MRSGGSGILPRGNDQNMSFVALRSQGVQKKEEDQACGLANLQERLQETYCKHLPARLQV